MTAKKSVKKGNSSKNTLTIVIAVALLIIAAIVCGLGWASQKDGKWFHESDMAKWCNSWGKGSTAAESSTQPQLIALTDEGEELLSGGTYAMPKAMTIVSDVSAADSQFAADGEFTITASVDNEYISGAMFDFIAYFPEGAENKAASDYIEIIPISGDSATLKLLAPFGAPIEIKATLVGTESYATCRVDYLQRIGFSSAQSDIGYDFNTLSMHLTYSSESRSTCTVKGEFVVERLQLSLTEEFIGKLKSYLTFDITVKDCEAYDFTFKTLSNDYWLDFKASYSGFIEGFDELDQKHQEAVYYAWYTAARDEDGHIRTCNANFTVTINYVYGGRVISAFTQLPDGGFGRIGISGSEKGSNISPDVELNGNVTL